MKPLPIADCRLPIAAIFHAIDVYHKFKAPRSFRDDLAAHFAHGYVVNRPTAFAMARPVRAAAPERELADISHRFESPDCWFIWSAAGNLRELLALLPFPLPFIAFHRGKGPHCGRLRIYRLEQLTRRIS